MNHFSRLFCALLLVIPTVSILAQEPGAPPQPTSARVEPPPPDWSSQKFEERADTLQAKKAYLDAIDYYRAALAKSDTAVLHTKIGVCLIQSTRYAEAKKEFERAIRIDKKYAPAHNNLGAVYYQAKRYGSSVKEY